MFSSVHHWNDTRVLHKEAASLAKRYDVELHIPAPFEYKLKKNVKIYGLPQWKKVSERRKIRKELLKRIRRSDGEVFHFHDPELIPLGLYIKFFRRKKVIYDIHEDFGSDILEKHWIPGYLRKTTFFVYKLLEKAAKRFFDKLILAEKLYTEFIDANYEIILNYPIPDRFQENKRETILYVGGIIEHRGIMEMLETAKLVKERFPEIIFEIIGPVQKEALKIDIQKKIDLLDIAGNVRMRGRLPYETLPEYLAKAKIGLALNHPHGNHIKSLLTKFYEYMMYKIPIVISDFPLWKDFIEETQCGICVNPFHTKEITASIIFLLENEEEGQRMGENGCRAVWEKFNWNVEEKKLFQVYDSISN